MGHDIDEMVTNGGKAMDSMVDTKCQDREGPI